jgi:hypothetical protein
MLDWTRLLDGQRGSSLTIGIIRGRREQTVSMNVPGAARRGEFNLEIPDLGPEMQKLRDELSRLGPELQRSVDAERARATREVERALRDMRKEFEQEEREHQRELHENGPESQ